MRAMKRLLALWLLLTLVACQVSLRTAPANETTSSPASSPSAPTPQREVNKQERLVRHAEAELAIKQLENKLAVDEAQAERSKAMRELEEAKRSLDAFTGQVMPRELDEKRMQLDASMHRAEHAKDELNELTAMYEADEFAKSTKELVLKRGRRELEMAERGLALARAELQHFEGTVLPKRQRELEHAVHDAERALHAQAGKEEKRRMEARLAEQRSVDQLTELREALNDLRQKASKDPS